jgi:uncharacterized membrane protein
MKNQILSAALILSAVTATVTAHAANATSPASTAAPTTSLNCQFTEPFFSLDFDLVTGVVTKTEPDWENDAAQTITTVVARNVRVVTDSSDPFLPKYVVNKEDGSLLAELVMNMQGSNGMSDTVYPFEIQFVTDLHGKQWGGCSSNNIAPLDPHE